MYQSCVTFAKTAPQGAFFRGDIQWGSKARAYVGTAGNSNCSTEIKFNILSLKPISKEAIEVIYNYDVWLYDTTCNELLRNEKYDNYKQTVHVKNSVLTEIVMGKKISIPSNLSGIGIPWKGTSKISVLLLRDGVYTDDIDYVNKYFSPTIPIEDVQAAINKGKELNGNN